eukprot:gene25-14_t
MAHMMLESKRATRGTRMNALVGQAADDDDAFWGNDVWQEGGGSDEESFRTVDDDDKPDEFDSDFNDSESDDDEEEDEEEEKAAQKGGKVQAKVTNRYKDPALLKKAKGGIKNPFAQTETNEEDAMDVDDGNNDGEKTSLNHGESSNQPRKAVRKHVTYELAPRTVRDSTKTKTKMSDAERIAKDEEEKKKKKPKPKPATAHFKFQDLLEEALQTEEENRKWLETRKFWLQQKEEQDRKLLSKGDTVAKDYIRFYSRRNVGTYVSFSSNEAVPPCLRPDANQPPPPPPSNICVITGLPAKYRDPKTQLPYANAEAFRELRRRHERGKLPMPTESAPHPSRRGSEGMGKVAQKTIRIVTDEASMDVDDDSPAVSSSAGVASSVGSIRPMLSIPRPSSQSNLPRSGSVSQMSTPRLNGVAGKSSPMGRSSNGDGSSQAQGKFSPTRPIPSIRGLDEDDMESWNQFEDDKMLVEASRSGRVHREGINAVYIASSSTTPEEIASMAWPAGVVIRPASSTDEPRWEPPEAIKQMLADDVSLVLTLPIKASSQRPAST